MNRPSHPTRSHSSCTSQPTHLLCCQYKLCWFPIWGPGRIFFLHFSLIGFWMFFSPTLYCLMVDCGIGFWWGMLNFLMAGFESDDSPIIRLKSLGSSSSSLIADRGVWQDHIPCAGEVGMPTATGLSGCSGLLNWVDLGSDHSLFEK